MFENDIEMLSNELNSLVQEYNILETKLVDNNKKERIANRLVELKKEVKKYRSNLVSNCLVCNSALLTSCLLIGIIAPNISLLVFLVILLCASLPCGIFVVDSLLDWLRSKSEYEKLATDDNLELVDDIDNIKITGLELNKQCNYLEKMISNYSELVGYLKDYNNMISYLEVIRKRKVEKINKLFDEYLNEKVDYSKVHLSEWEISQKKYLKKLTDIVK